MNQKYKQIGILTGFFLVSVTSSMDIWLNISIGGFNVRFAILVMMIMLGWFVLERLRTFRFPLPPWIWYLLLIAVWNAFVSPLSVFPLRSIAYAVWLLIFTGWVIALFVWSEEDESLFPWMLFLFIVSFLPSLIVGWLQWAIPSLTINGSFPWKTQGELEVGRLFIQRANGWNYEPSYYATYLITLPPLLWVWFRQAKNHLEKTLLALLFLFSITMVALSTSRMGWLALILFIAGVATIEGIYWLSKKKIITKKKINIILGIAGGVFLAIGCFLLLFKWNQLELLLKKIFIYSYNDRMEGIRNVLEVLFRHPITGVSLGGVSTDIAASWLDTPPQSNSLIKPFEGAMVWLEVIAAWGVVGFFLLGALFVSALRWLKNMLKKSSPQNKAWIIALAGGLFLQFFLLMFNQNLLRVYVWNSIAIFACGIFALSKSSQPVAVLPTILPSLTRWSKSFLTGILLSSVGIVGFVAQPIVVQLYGGSVTIHHGDETPKSTLWYNTGRELHGGFDGIPLIFSNGIASFDFYEKRTNISERFFLPEETNILWESYLDWKNVLESQKATNSIEYTLFKHLEEALATHDSLFTNSPQHLLSAINSLLDDTSFWSNAQTNLAWISPRTQEELRSLKNPLRLRRLLLEDMAPWVPRNPQEHGIYHLLLSFYVTNASQTNTLRLDSLEWYTSLGKVKDTRYFPISFSPQRTRWEGRILLGTYPIRRYCQMIKTRPIGITIAILLFLIGWWLGKESTFSKGEKQ